MFLRKRKGVRLRDISGFVGDAKEAAKILKRLQATGEVSYNLKTGYTVEQASLFSRILSEYGGIGGRIATYRHPTGGPSPGFYTPAATTAKQKKRQCEADKARERTRERLRELAVESRRPLKTIGAQPG